MSSNLLNYESNFINNKNDILTNQNINQNKQKFVLDLLKHDSEFIKDITETLENNKKTNVFTKEKITRINFDSSNRNINPKNILTGDLIYLNSNPLSFIENSNKLNIKTPTNHNLKENDRIILQNVVYKTINLKGGFELIKDSNYIKIHHSNHGIKNNETKNNFLIEISGIIGNFNNNTFLQNIPLALINKTHKLQLFNDDDENGSNDYYYIQIQEIARSVYIDTTSNIKIIFKSIAGIPLNEINANYPININQINGYLTVSSIISNKEFVIGLSKSALITINNVGGNKIYYSKIKSFIPAYIKPNDYRINLNKTLENITKIKLISTEFPNTEKVIKIYPENTINNKLYFQVLEEGNYIYKISIIPGNYTSEGLAETIKQQIEKVKRINYSDNLIIKEPNNVLLEKSEYFSSIVAINQFTDIFSLSLYSVVTIMKGIKVITSGYTDSRKRIIINHINHGLSVGSSVTLANCISTSLVSSIVLNIEHVIESIQDVNNYIIKLPLHNESSTTDDTGGGSAINILIPITFRLLFNYPDTIGNILGFSNVREENSITPFFFIVYNNIAYEYDYFKDSVGNEIFFDSSTQSVLNNVIQLSGYNYILMTCNIFNNNESLTTTSNIDNIFAKLLLSNSPGSILFNQFIQLADVLKNPIKTLNELEFKFFSPNGELYDFSGLNHSFTLEFYEQITDTKSMNINIKSGLAAEFINNENNENNENDISEFQEDRDE